MSDHCGFSFHLSVIYDFETMSLSSDLAFVVYIPGNLEMTQLF